jgi:quercetin dioxygenase-like cupin family protein
VAKSGSSPERDRLGTPIRSASQILIVTDGVGWVQQSGGPVQVIREGDVVWIPADVKHWHGATPTTTMTHIAFQEQLDGRAVDWLEKVNDEQYRLMK